MKLQHSQSEKTVSDKQLACHVVWRKGVSAEKAGYLAGSHRLALTP